MPIGTGASFTLGVSPVNLGYLLPLVITLGSYKLSRQFVIVPLNLALDFNFAGQWNANYTPLLNLILSSSIYSLFCIDK